MLRIVPHPIGPLPRLTTREIAWQPALDPAIVPTTGTEPTLARLRAAGALAVTTGQQPGLFAGPLYTVYKAFAAAAIARVLEQRWQRPVVPLFWIAGDDHDFAEASVTSWLDPAGEVVTWGLPPRPASAAQLPMAAQPLPAEVSDGLDMLEQSLPDGEPRHRTMVWLRNHYRPGATVHQAYAGALAELLAPYGILCVDPTHAAFKCAQAPMLLRALQNARSIDTTLAALPATDSGIASGDGATLVFMVTPAGRERLMVDGDRFRARRSGERYTLAQLERLLESEPQRFSANVLLRPVIESVLLPTVAYVAGPGELRYLEGPAAALYPMFDTPAQTPVPRWSGTVIPRWAERLLGRLHVTAMALLDDDGTIGRAILERNFPGDARQALDALRKQITRSGVVITAAGKRADPVLTRAMQGRAKRLHQVVDSMEQVLQRHLRKRDNTAYAQWLRLGNGLRPGGQPQERVFSTAAFLGRYGDEWLNAVTGAADEWAAQLPDTST